MNRFRSSAAQLFALVGLLVLGLALARGLDLAFAYEHMRMTGDGRTFSALMGMLGAIYLPLAGTLLLLALVLSLPNGARLPVVRARLLGFASSTMAFAVLVVVASRAVDAQLLGVSLGDDLLLALQLDLALALPVACLVAALAASGLALWRAGSREA